MLTLICNTRVSKHNWWFVFVLWICQLALADSVLVLLSPASRLCRSEIPSNSSLLGRSLAKLGEVMYVLESQQNGLLKHEVKELLFSQLSSTILYFKESGSFLHTIQRQTG